MLHVQEPCTDARSAIDGQLVMAALRGIQVELSTMRGVLENVERTSSNNAQRLEAIDSRLREAATVPGAAAAASQAAQPAMRPPDKMQMAYAAAGILSLLLIVPRLRRLLLRSLRTSGAAVDHVANGSQADAALMTNSEFDLLILDLGLPQMHGLEILKRLRARGSQMPVLVLTAADSVEERVKGLDHGADDYMAKPFSLQELEARVRDALEVKDGELVALREECAAKDARIAELLAKVASAVA